MDKINININSKHRYSNELICNLPLEFHRMIKATNGECFKLNLNGFVNIYTISIILSIMSEWLAFVKSVC